MIYSADADVDVIYIAPMAVPEDTIQYYRRLLGLRSAIQSGIAEDQSTEQISSRYTIITPEAINRFPVRFLKMQEFIIMR